MNGRILNSIDLCVVLLILVCGVSCTTEVPSEPDEKSNVSINLSVSFKGAEYAEYSGSKIPAYIEFSDSITCTFDKNIPGHIQIVTGNGKFIYPEASIGKLFTDSLLVYLYWTSYPDAADSEGERIDTIQVQIGQDKSNIAEVEVQNIAPEITSLIIGDTSISVSGNIFNENIYEISVDTSGLISLIAQASDNDGSELNYTWRAGNESRIQSKNEATAYYHVPETNILDTIGMIVYDGDGGNAEVKAVLVKESGVNPFFADSIAFGDTVFYPESIPRNSFEYITPYLESSYIRVYSSSDSVPTSDFDAKMGVITYPENSGESEALYQCSNDVCTDTLTQDTSFIMDTVSVRLYNSDQEMSFYSIKIRKAQLSQAEGEGGDTLFSLDSISVDSLVFDSNVILSDSVYVSLDSVRDYSIMHYYTLSDSVSSFTAAYTDSSYLSFSDTATVYTPVDSVYQDTVEKVFSINGIIVDTSRIYFSVTPDT
ncbi:MAG: hypothetical protein ACOCSE_06255 [Chitinivibrionales bacterium]